MARGVGGSSPSNVAQHLKGIDFPADKGELLKLAEQNGAGEAIMDRLRKLPEQQYGSMADVMKGYGGSK